MQDYFEPLVQKEKLEEKMKSIREMKCRAVTCKSVCYSFLLSLSFGLMGAKYCTIYYVSSWNFHFLSFFILKKIADLHVKI